jgi:tubulin--tyrosine ligase
MKLDVFHFLPLTFHIKDGQEDPKYFEFLKYYHRRAKEVAINNELKGRVKEYNAWIVKPGENSNRGQGIKMCLNL